MRGEEISELGLVELVAETNRLVVWCHPLHWSQAISATGGDRSIVARYGCVAQVLLIVDFAFLGQF